MTTPAVIKVDTPGGMSFDLSPEQAMIRRTAREFAEREIIPGARERDRGEIFPHDIIARLGALGFLGPTVPEQYGGLGLDFISVGALTHSVKALDISMRIQ